MIYNSTINTLSEEELSILFLISDKFLSPLNIDTTIHFVKMLKIDVVCLIIDVLKPQAQEQFQNIFDSLKKKLTE